MKPAEQDHLSRSKFLRLSTRAALSLAGLLGLAGLVRYFSHSPGSGKQTVFDLGLIGDFPESGKLLRYDIPAAIYRDPHGFRAFSLVCTHLGCLVEESKGGFSCPCHGSEFSIQGKMLQGPAEEDLPELKLEINPEGRLLLHTDGGLP